MAHVSCLDYVRFRSRISYIHKYLCIFVGVPVVYALLPDRKAITYVYVFNVLLSEARKLGKSLQPSLVMTDFEGGLTKAISLEVRYSRFSVRWSDQMINLFLASFSDGAKRVLFPLLQSSVQKCSVARIVTSIFGKYGGSQRYSKYDGIGIGARATCSFIIR